MSDGYYFRDGRDKVRGPLDAEEFEEARASGEVKPGMRTWRQKGGLVYKVNIERKFTVGKVFSFSACGHAFEFAMIFVVVAMMIFVFSIPKLQTELLVSAHPHQSFFSPPLLLSHLSVSSILSMKGPGV